MKVYEIGDVVIYGGEGLCRVDEITEKKFDNQIISYYVLRKLEREESVTYVPVSNEKSLAKMRHILTKDEIHDLIARMPEETNEWINNPRERQKSFKEIMLYGNSKDLIRLIRTLYLHQEKQLNEGKKLHSADERIFKEAEKLICSEIAYVFEIPKEETINFIMKEIPKN